MSIRLKNSKFDLLFEDNYTRYQAGGLVSQDIVKFRKNTLNHPYFKNAVESMRERIQDLIETDLVLRVGSVKMVRAGASNGTPSTLGYMVDVIREKAPGL